MLQEMIEMGERLCANLEKAAQAERDFTLYMCIEFKRMAWEIDQVTNELKSFKQTMELQ